MRWTFVPHTGQVPSVAGRPFFIVICFGFRRMSPSATRTSQSIPPAASILGVTGAHLHLYDKAPRPGRKVGHINLVAESDEALNLKIGELQPYVG